MDKVEEVCIKFNLKPSTFTQHHSRVDLPQSLFDQLNPEYFITDADTMKCMLANDDEIAHLEGLGVDFDGDYDHDYFEIRLEGVL